METEREQKWTAQTQGQALLKLEPSPRSDIVKLHLGSQRTERAGVTKAHRENLIPRTFIP